MSKDGKIENRKQAWIEAFRLRTLPLALSSIITGSALASFHGKFDALIFGLACLTTIFLQVLSNLANDLGDSLKGTDNEHRIGPDRSIQSGFIGIGEMKIVVVIFALLSLVSGVALLFASFQSIDYVTILFFVLGLAAIAAAIKYTVGKSAYGYSGMGDLFVFLFFGLLGVVGSYFLYTKTLSSEVFLPAISIGLFSTAVLNLNNMRDIENDRNSGKHTMVVKMGLNAARNYHLLICSLGMFTAIAFGLLHFDVARRFIFVISYPLIVKQMKRVMTIKDPRDFDPLLKRMAIATFVFSILIALSYAEI